MNLCKSGLISARTKSLREKFSRNRSYSELSFKDSNTTSSLVSTPTESCSGSLAERSSSQTNFALCSGKKSSAPAGGHVPGHGHGHGHSHSHGPSSVINQHHRSAADSYYSADPYCSALDLSVPGSAFDEPRFPWQRDVAIQCDLISAPVVWPLPPTQPQSQPPFPTKRAGGASSAMGGGTWNNRGEQQGGGTGTKKKTSSSSTSSAASTLINAAAATLRMTGIGGGGGGGNSEGVGGSGCHSSSGGNRFWKSSLLLPSLNVSSVAENAHMLGHAEGGGNFVGDSSATDSPLRRQKSSRWASASAVRRPVMLKRAASFDSRGGYARLVQSTSSPSSPPEDLNDFEAPLSALPILTTTRDEVENSSSNHNYHSGQSGQLASGGGAFPGSFSARGGGGGGTLSVESQSHQSHSTSHLASGSGGGGHGNFFFSSHHSLSNAFRTTALLGASAAMTAAAPFTTSLLSSPKTSDNSSAARGGGGQPSNHPHHYQGANFSSSSSSTTATTGGNLSNNNANNNASSSSSSNGRRKLSSNEISLKELRRKQFMTTRKQPSSAPDSFDDDSPFSPREKSFHAANASTSSGENELFNFNTVHRLLNISLSASNTDSVVKPFLLELPDSNTACHPNLPSPNVQSEEVNPVLRKMSLLSRAPHKALASRHSDSGAGDKRHKGLYLDLDDDYLFDDEEEETLSEEPPAAALQRRRRRRALVPPKLITDGYESCTEFDEGSKSRLRGSSSSGRLSPGARSGSVNNISTEADNASDQDQITVLGGSLTPNSKSAAGSKVDMEAAMGGEGQGAQRHLTPNVTIEGIEAGEAGDGKLVNLSTTTEGGGGGGGGQAAVRSARLSSPKSPRPVRTSNSGSSGSGGSATNSHHHLGVNQGNSRNRRRSSVVVIPPMQICPGDLLVYSKVLSQRSNMIDNLEGNFSTALLSESEHNRKHKNTWSLLRLFDRSTSRNKAAADQILCGLEEVLSQMQPTNSFVDEAMLRYRSIGWNEFLMQQEERRISNASSFASAASSLVNSASAAAAAAASAGIGIGCSRFFNNARFSSLQSNALDANAAAGGGAGGAGGGGSGSGVSGHVCKKISLPCGGIITRTMQQNLEKLQKLRQEAGGSAGGEKQSATGELPAFSLASGLFSSLPEGSKPRLQRTESASTVSDVESINEHVFNETSPTSTRRKPTEAPELSHATAIGAGGGGGGGAHSAASKSPRGSESHVTEEELGGDRYVDSDSYCCSCMHITKREQRRREALWELFQSDLLFLTEHLMVLKNVFMEPLKKIQVEGYAMFAEPEVLFGNLDELCLVTYAFCREFLNILLSQTSGNEISVTTILVKVFQQSGRAAALTQAYHRYTLNYINALNYLETLRRQIEFTEFEKWCNRDPRCKKLQLTDLLVAPVQHVMRVPLLLKEIETRTVDALEKTSIQTIIQEQEHSLRELDDKMRWLKNFERLLEIQRNIQWPSVLDMDPKVYVPEFLKSLLAKQPCERLIVSPRRQIVLEGPLMVHDSGKPVEMYVFLFDDLLLISRRKKGLGKKQSTLTERFVSNCSGRNSSFSSVVSVGGGAAPARETATGSVSTTSSAVNSAVVNAASATTTAGGVAVGATGGEPTHGPLSGGGGGASGLFKYVVYKQPLSLDRFYIHDILPTTEGAANLKNGFVLVCLNRFQQVITLHTFQAASESAKNVWLSKLRDTSDRWKRTLQNNTFRNNQQTPHGHKDVSSGRGGGGGGHHDDHHKGHTTHSSSTSSAAGATAAASGGVGGGGSGNSGGGGHPSSSSAFGHRLNLSNFQQLGPGASRSAYSKNKSPPPRNLEVGANQRLSSGSVSINSSLRDNASCSYMFDDSIITTSTFT